MAATTGRAGVLDAALGHAAHGQRVMPCRGKRPAIPGGVHAASRDPHTITSWFTGQPELNIGIATGDQLVVLDIDQRPGIDGYAALRELVDRANVDWPVTHTISTPSGGAHLYFVPPPGQQIHSSCSRLGPGLDVKSTGGYVIAPPSSIDGRPYEALDDRDPRPLPAWLIAADNRSRSASRPASHPPPVSRPERYAAAALDYETRAVATAVAGCRNDTLVTAARNLGQLAADGLLDLGHIAEALTVAALDVGLGEREVAATIASGFAFGLAHTRSARNTP